MNGLKNETHKIQIKNKYVKEALRKRYNYTYVKDNNYYNQIVAKNFKKKNEMNKLFQLK